MQSHGVPRKLPRDAGRTLPAHGGAKLLVRSRAALDSLTVRWRGAAGVPAVRARRASADGRSWRVRVPHGPLPARAVFVARTPEARFRRSVRLREYDHRRVVTAPGRLVNGRPVWHIEWAFRPRSLRELVSPAPAGFPNRPAMKAAVVAEVTRIADGPPLVEDDHPDHRVPTQRIHFALRSTWFGQVARRFTVFKTGSPEVWAEADPLYAVGERYLLVLDRRSGRSWFPVAPEGRIAIRGGTLWPLIASRMSRKLSGLTPGEARAAIRRAIARRPGR